MPRIIELNRRNKKTYNLHMLDSDTGATCRTEKAVDITEDCPTLSSNKKRALLLFTRATRGRIVQIVLPSNGETVMGTAIHFFIHELDAEMRAAPRDDTFGSTARDLGLTKLQLRQLIEAQAPA